MTPAQEASTTTSTTPTQEASQEDSVTMNSVITSFFFIIYLYDKFIKFVTLQSHRSSISKPISAADTQDSSSLQSAVQINVFNKSIAFVMKHKLIDFNYIDSATNTNS